MQSYPGADTYLATFTPVAFIEGRRRLEQATGVALQSALDPQLLAVDGRQIGGIYADRLKASVAYYTPEQYARGLAITGPGSDVLTLEPIGKFFAPRVERGTVPVDNEVWPDDPSSTWGMKAIGFSDGDAEGVSVAVLDTGFSPGPDFQDRTVCSYTCVPEYPDATDWNGHGTMCVGIACGGATPEGRRYGVASKSTIVAIQVLDPLGHGHPIHVLSGMELAIALKCQVISMSLGVRTAKRIEGFENVAAQAIEAGAVIVAAAGDHAPQTVMSPADCRNIVAVGAIDAAGQMYRRSCPSGSEPGSEVDLVGPGVNVFSSMPTTSRRRYAIGSGTSFAVPFVSGVAALHFAAGDSAKDVLGKLTQQIYRLPHLRPADVGAGLVQAPRPKGNRS